MDEARVRVVLHQAEHLLLGQQETRQAGQTQALDDSIFRLVVQVDLQPNRDKNTNKSLHNQSDHTLALDISCLEIVMFPITLSLPYFYYKIVA